MAKKKKNQNIWQKQSNKTLVDQWKSQHGCALCKREFDPVVLDCHHIDEKAKSFTISKGVSYGYSTHRMKEELKKCVVHCANCHRRREHFKRLERKDKGIKTPPYDTLPGVWENTRKYMPERVVFEDDDDRSLFY